MKLEVGDIKMDSDGGIQIGAAVKSNSQPSHVAHSIFTQLPPERRVDEPISKSVLLAMVVMALVALAAMLLLVAGHPLAAALLFWSSFAKESKQHPLKSTLLKFIVSNSNLQSCIQELASHSAWAASRASNSSVSSEPLGIPCEKLATYSVVPA